MPRGRKKQANPELRQVESTNDLNDEQKAALLTRGIEALEQLIEEKDEYVAKIRNQRKVLKSEGFPAEEVNYALWLRKKGDEAAKEALDMRLRISEWLGKPLGYQPSLDLGVAAE